MTSKRKGLPTYSVLAISVTFSTVNAPQQANSTMEGNLVENAKMAEQAERYDDMAKVCVCVCYLSFLHETSQVAVRVSCMCSSVSMNL